jgi:hypothetical protein
MSKIFIVMYLLRKDEVAKNSEGIEKIKNKIAEKN